jgi:hypothetical protein
VALQDPEADQHPVMIYNAGKTLSIMRTVIMGSPCCEPEMSQSARFHEKRDSGEKPKSLS